MVPHHPRPVPTDHAICKAVASARRVFSASATMMSQLFNRSTAISQKLWGNARLPASLPLAVPFPAGGGSHVKGSVEMTLAAGLGRSYGVGLLRQLNPLVKRWHWG